MVTNEDLELVQTEFVDAFRSLGFKYSEAIALWASYYNKMTEAHRFYHDLSHIAFCLKMADKYWSGYLSTYTPREVIYMILFHDYFYDPKRDDNEVRSAQALVQYIHPRDVGHAVEGILCTVTHEVPSTSIAKENISLLLDIDMSILGAPFEEFMEYERNIRREYSFVPHEVFYKKRGDILRNFLKKPKMFYNDWFRGYCEFHAIKNLKSLDYIYE